MPLAIAAFTENSSWTWSVDAQICIECCGDTSKSSTSRGLLESFLEDMMPELSLEERLGISPVEKDGEV